MEYVFLPGISLSLRNAGLDALDLRRAKACGSTLVLGSCEVRALSIVSIGA